MHVDYEPEDAEYLRGIKGSATYKYRIYVIKYIQKYFYQDAFFVGLWYTVHTKNSGVLQFYE